MNTLKRLAKPALLLGLMWSLLSVAVAVYYHSWFNAAVSAFNYCWMIHAYRVRQWRVWSVSYQSYNLDGTATLIVRRFWTYNSAERFARAVKRMLERKVCAERLEELIQRDREEKK